jgi:hypothetical protein
MRISRVALFVVEIALVGIVTAVAVQALSSRAGGTETSTDLTAADLARLQISVAPVASAAGLISADEARVIGARSWQIEPSKPDVFLKLVTDEGTIGTEHSLQQTPAWIVRYSGLSVPGPKTAVTFHFRYVFIDAATGEELFSRWTP